MDSEASVRVEHDTLDQCGGRWLRELWRWGGVNVCRGMGEGVEGTVTVAGVGGVDWAELSWNNRFQF